ncbi:hypothetical protein P7C70_g9466, partial [Phenoliferia sp. Uapishka_3]
MTLLRYRKTTREGGIAKEPIIRFFHEDTGRILAVYLLHVRPAYVFARQCLEPTFSHNDLLFPRPFGRPTPPRVRNAFSLTTDAPHVGAMPSQFYNQSIPRVFERDPDFAAHLKQSELRHIAVRYTRSFSLLAKDDREAGLALQAGHSTTTRENTYGTYAGQQNGSSEDALYSAYRASRIAHLAYALDEPPPPSANADTAPTQTPSHAPPASSHRPAATLTIPTPTPFLHPFPSTSPTAPLAWSHVDVSSSSIQQCLPIRVVPADSPVRAAALLLWPEAVPFKGDINLTSLVRYALHDRLGQPLLGIVPTGTGKTSLFYLAVVLYRRKWVLVITPFRSLADDIERQSKAFGLPCWRWDGQPPTTAAGGMMAATAEYAGTAAFQQWVHGCNNVAIVFYDEVDRFVQDANWRLQLLTCRQMARLDVPTVLLTGTLQEYEIPLLMRNLQI